MDFGVLSDCLFFDEDKKSSLLFIGTVYTLFGVLVGIETVKQINEEKEETKYLKNIMFYNDREFYCDSLYYGYLPEKFRKKYIPTLKWNNNNKKARSFAIELIIDDEYNKPNFLIINIPVDSSEINESSQNGDIIINYNGIPENAFSAYFNLYTYDKDKIDLEYFQRIKFYIIEGFEDIESLISYKILKVI